MRFHSGFSNFLFKIKIIDKCLNKHLIILKDLERLITVRREQWL